MRISTFSVASVFVLAVLAMAMWPTTARFGTPQAALAQDNPESSPTQVEEENLVISAATRQDQVTEEALKQVVTLDFDDLPFREVTEELSKKTGLNFILSSSASDDSLTEDEVISIKLKNVSLGKFLDLMLREYNATYHIDSGIVVFISLDEASDDQWLRVKMFDCRKLVKALPPTTNRYDSFLQQGLNGSKGGGGVFNMQSSGKNGGPQQQTTKAKSADELKDKKSVDEQAQQLLQEQIKKLLDKNLPPPSSEFTLKQLVTTMIYPDTWCTPPPTAEVVNGILVVRQSEAVLRRIDNFLEDLRGKVLREQQPITEKLPAAKNPEPRK